MMKRLIGVVKAFLFTMCLIGMFSMNVQASEEVTASGDWYDLTWKLESGVLTISGEGNMMTSLDYRNYPWFEYRMHVNSIVIEEGVTSIGLKAFAYCAAESATISEGISGIYGFYHCYRLDEVNLPDSANSINPQAFEGCTKLSDNTLQDILSKVTYIYRSAFCDCDALTSVNIPANIIYIDEGVFGGCDNLSEITVASENEYYCAENNMLFDKSKETLLAAATADLFFLQIPNGVSRIGQRVFLDCASICGYVLPESLREIGNGAFVGADCVQVDIPEGVTTIEGNAFSNCSSLYTITIPTSIKTIGFAAFRGAGITDVTIPKGVTTIEDKAFGYNSYDLAIDGFIIRGYTGSAAEEYAINNNITFVSLGNVEDTRSAIESFVTRMYQQCLDRDPDQNGLDGWVSQLEGGYMNGAQIAEQFVFSNEMLSKNLSDEEFVNILYRAMMGREADDAGRTGWVNQLSNGYMTRSEVTKSFVESTEFSTICSSYGIIRGDYDASVAPIEHFVTRFYTLCLERNADQKGLYGWVNNLKNQYMNGAQIAEQFFFSEEFVNRNVSDEKYIELLYNTLMGRPSDENGKTGWLGQLQNGNMTRKDMMKAFIESNEFTEICETYGITRGSL